MIVRGRSLIFRDLEGVDPEMLRQMPDGWFFKAFWRVPYFEALCVNPLPVVLWHCGDSQTDDFLQAFGRVCDFEAFWVNPWPILLWHWGERQTDDFCKHLGEFVILKHSGWIPDRSFCDFGVSARQMIFGWDSDKWFWDTWENGPHNLGQGCHRSWKVLKFIVWLFRPWNVLN